MASSEKCEVELNQGKLEDLDHLWRPFMKLSRALGFFPFVQEYGDGGHAYWSKLWNAYSMLVICGFCFRLGFVVGPRVVEGESITIVDVDFVSVIVFQVHLIASTASFVYFLNFTSYLNDMRHLWSSLSFAPETATRTNSFVKRKMKCALVLCAFALVQAVIGNEIYRVVFGFPAIGVLYEVFLAWCIIVHVIQIGLFCSLCCAISCLLQGFCQDMETTLVNGNMCNHLKLFKSIYTTIVDFMQVSNQFFGIFVGFLFISSLLHVCFDTYTLIVHTRIHNNISGIAAWVVYSLITTIIVCSSAGKIYDQAKRPYRILLKLDFSTCSPVQQNETLLLLDCFTNLEASISMFRIIPITTQTLPTIISVYFSYMILLFQFPTVPSKSITTQGAFNNESITY